LYESDPILLLNVYIYLVFVGNGWMALVPSRLPHLTRLFLEMCAALLPEYVQELMAAVPKLNISK
jgi:hypothetical protein